MLSLAIASVYTSPFLFIYALSAIVTAICVNQIILQTSIEQSVIQTKQVMLTACVIHEGYAGSELSDLQILAGSNIEDHLKFITYLNCCVIFSFLTTEHN